MNFIKGMLGLKKKEEPKEEFQSTIEQSIKDFSIIASVYNIDRKTQEKSVFCRECVVTFIEEEPGFNYSLELTPNSHDTKKIQKAEGADAHINHYLPIDHSMGFQQYKSKKGNKKLQFDYLNIQYDIDEESTIRVMIDTTVEADEVLAHVFIDYLSKLLYQTKNLNSYQEAKSKDQYRELIQYVEKDTGLSDVSSLSSVSLTQQSEVQEVVQQQLQQQQQQQEERKSDEITELNREFKKINITTNIQQSQDQPQKPQEVMQVDEERLNLVLQDQLQEESIRLACTGKYYLVDETNSLHVIEAGVVYILKQREGVEGLHFQMIVLNQFGKQIYNKFIVGDMQFQTDLDQNYIKWIQLDEKDPNFIELLCIFFDGPQVALQIQFAMNQMMLETKNQKLLKDQLKNQEDINYISSFGQSTLKMEEEIISEYKDEVEWDKQSGYINFDNKQNDQNVEVCMDQARVLDRTFVNKDGIIGVYRADQNDKGKIDFLANLPELKDLSGNKIAPSKLMMTEKDHKMLLLNKNNNQQVYQVDLERAQVIRELQVDGINDIHDMCAEFKHAELENTQIFNCCNKRNLFKMDPRINNAAVCQAESESKKYTVQNNFTCIQANSNGNVAVGNHTGDIRLYTKIGQNAKCNYVGFGDPITNIDTTKDGNWLIATCKYYLILLPTFSQDQSQNGFKKNIKMVERRKPFKLQIQPQDLKKYNIREVNFRNAKFDDNNKNQEKHIITSTGKFSVIWNFSSIVRGNNNNYEIKALNDEVKDIQFKFNNEDEVFAALPNEVRLQTTKKKI